MDYTIEGKTDSDVKGTQESMPATLPDSWFNESTYYRHRIVNGMLEHIAKDYFGMDLADTTNPFRDFEYWYMRFGHIVGVIELTMFPYKKSESHTHIQNVGAYTDLNYLGSAIRTWMTNVLKDHVEFELGHMLCQQDFRNHFTVGYHNPDLYIWFYVGNIYDEDFDTKASKVLIIRDIDFNQESFNTDKDTVII